MPPGTGVMIMTADNTEVFDNTIRGNKSLGVGVTSLYIIYPRDTVFDLGPLPENNWIHDNTYEHNGYDPDQSLTGFRRAGRRIFCGRARAGATASTIPARARSRRCCRAAIRLIRSSGRCGGRMIF